MPGDILCLASFLIRVFAGVIFLWISAVSLVRQIWYHVRMAEEFAAEYHEILCPEFPDFLREYSALPLIQRLGGAGLLCGTDWTPLFHNAFFYSRLDHSVGAALITWNFTRSKTQAVASLLHDAATPAFSHVSDFKNADAASQVSTERLTARMIGEDSALQALLARDGIPLAEVSDYHIYPVADNELPGLSADRLEYMYPSGAALAGIWSLAEIRKNYSCITVLKNERGEDELGFSDEEQCFLYTKKFLEASMILQRNEDKVAMQLMADILSEAEKISLADERDFYAESECSLIERFSDFARKNPDAYFSRLFRTFRGMKKIVRSETEIPGMYCVSVEVKRRYVDPLVRCKGAELSRRISALNMQARSLIEQFLHYSDSMFGCTEFL